LNQKTGSYNLSSSTIYNNVVYNSKNKSVLIRKIPVDISLTTDKSNYYVNESISFSGEVVDYKKCPLAVNLSLIFAGYTISIESDTNGSFGYSFNKYLSFGPYAAYVIFEPMNIYQKDKSNIVEIKINTPTKLTISTPKNKYQTGEEIIITGVLTNNINNSPLTNRTIDIYVNDKKIGSVETDERGNYNYTYETSSLTQGRYKLFSRFVSKNVEFRSSSSTTIEIMLQLSVGQSMAQLLHSNLPFIIAIFVIALFTTLLIYYFRKEVIHFFTKEKPSTDTFTPQEESVVPPIVKKPIMNLNEFMAETSGKSRDELKQSIIKKYQQFIGYLSKTGISLNRGVTHLDIRRELLKQGFSNSATNKVTKAFEYAMYSPYTLDEIDVSLFNRNLRTLLQKLGV
ncbi:MAG: hypothetical protein ACOC80_09055, partial [Petrotogales bacterium]